MNSITDYIYHIRGSEGCLEDLKRVIKAGYYSHLNILLESVTFSREDKVTALFFTIKFGLTSKFEVLFDHISDLSDQDVRDGFTPLAAAYEAYALMPLVSGEQVCFYLLNKGFDHFLAISLIRNIYRAHSSTIYTGQRIYKEYLNYIKPKAPTLLNMPTPPQALTEADAPEEPIASRFLVVNGFVLNTSEFCVLGRLSSAFNSYDLEMQKRTGIPHQERLYKKGFDHE